MTPTIVTHTYGLPMLSTIAIIDQGVDLSLYGMKVPVIEEITFFENAKLSREIKSRGKRGTCHGTNICYIIKSFSPGSKILSLKLTAGENGPSVETLCSALNYCIGRPEVRIINISLAVKTEKNSELLLEKMFECHEKGKIIVAASHPDHRVQYFPAKAPFVFGVGIGITKSPTSFRYLGDGYINVLAKGVHQRLMSDNYSHMIRGGSSYSAAYFTSIVANIYAEEPQLDYNRLRGVLASRSEPIVPGQYIPKFGSDNTSFLTGLNSKMKVLVYGTDDEFVRILVSKYSRLVKVVMRYPINPSNRFDFTTELSIKQIDGILSPRIREYVDCLIVGNFLKNAYLVNIYFGYALIRLCTKMRVKVLYTDRFVRMAAEQAMLDL